jgi:serine-type D-Ala-D-Ala carboxypeptidase/endopeptidase (penicillin-binding protein 4)
MRRFLAGVAAIGALLATAVTGAAAQPSGQPRAAERTLDGALSQGMSQVGGASGAYVVDLTAGQPGHGLFAAQPDTPRLPASVQKLYTTTTALLLFGPAASLTTQILGEGTLDRHGGWHGTLYLRGGGDPTFGSSSFNVSAYGERGGSIQLLVSRLVHNDGIKAVYGRIVGDASYFDSLRSTAESNYQFDPYMEGSLSALAFNRGLINGGSAYIVHPAVFAARQLASAMSSAGVKVPRSTATGSEVTPPDAQVLATVHSPQIADLIHLTNTPSDNFFAEMLLKGIGAKFGGGGTTAAGAAVVRDEIASTVGVHPQFNDGSGLSRYDRTSPRQIVRLLRYMASNSDFVNSLAIAGETGTLAQEMNGTVAQGRCRGKTGTLHDVASLAGYCRAEDGHTLAFAFLMNSLSNPDYAHSIEANMAVAVAKYNG